jgi:hypothetical protein
MVSALADQWRFPHSEHRDLQCTECHALADVVAGRPALPGADDHAPCDRDACHRAAFLAKPGPFCVTCHATVDPTGQQPTTIAPYPPGFGSRALAATFSHSRHVDYAAMEKRVGFHVACSDCHARPAEASDPALPGHAECMRCHAAEAAVDGAPSMADCAVCHIDRDRQPTRYRKLIVDDLQFSHASHSNDRRGALIRCIECHVDVAEVSQTNRHEPPPTSVCVQCHDDDHRTQAGLRMRICETCHATRRETFGTLAPRSHLPASERPQNHTLAFRTDHDNEARASSEACSRCHSTMSGSARDTCDECHQSMRPQSHTVSWREFDHGPEAATDSQPCATCHNGGFCIACHARAPRSHFPLVEFARGSHAELALGDLRACTVCHDMDRDCVGFGCHTRQTL